MIHNGGTFSLMTPRWWARLSPDGRRGVFRAAPGGTWILLDARKDSIVGGTPVRVVSRKLEAAVQLFNNGMNENAFFRPLALTAAGATPPRAATL